MIALLMLLAMPGCAHPGSAESSSDIEAEEEQRPLRYSDQPPVVDSARRYQLPVDTRIALAGNYGELRPDHFHAGLDFKTDQSIGHPVYAFADGFVRRAAINAYGYGLVLYVEHPEMGLTSLYGHLDSFGERIMAKVRERQVRDELNNCDLTFDPDELPVKQGEVIALSGNTGSSGGPHVHFELRNIPDDDNDIFYDPQMFFLRELKDTQAPRISHIYLYPQPGEGLANGQPTRQVSPVTGRCATQGGIGGTVSKPLTAWGRVGLGLKAYDYMDEQANKYGVKEVRLLLELPRQNEEEKPRYQFVYHFKQDAFRYSETRYTNSLTDYAAWIGQKSMIMKSFIEPGNYLQQVDAQLGSGLVTIDEERPYRFIYELEDAHGNLTTLRFEVMGVRPEPGQLTPARTTGIPAEVLQPLEIDTAGVHFKAAAGVFYTDVDFQLHIADKAMTTRTVNVRRKNKKGKLVTVKQEQQVEVPCVSRIYTLGSTAVPMHSWCDVAIDLPDNLPKPEQLYLTEVDGGGSVKESRYEAAHAEIPARMTGKIRKGGRYAVRRDENGPVMSVTTAGWRRMQIEVGDADSGVKKFRVTIDGKFVPFDMDHSGHYYGEPCHYGIGQGQMHQIVMEAWDMCGNHSEVRLERKF